MKNYRQLFTFARTALERAYAPYSHFRVGTAIEADDGKIYAGCNVENVSYPCGTCAEAGALAAMVCGGSAKIRRILVTSDGTALIAPCGACLQRILEFSLPETEILLADREGIKKTMTINELLPNAFKEF